MIGISPGELWDAAKARVFEQRSKLSAADFEGMCLTYDQFLVLEKPSFQIPSPEELKAAKNEVLSTIQRIGVDKLVALFEQLFLEIASRDGSRATPKEKRVIETVYRSARFVRDIDPNLLNSLKECIVSQHGDFVRDIQATLPAGALQSDIDRVSSVTVARTIEQLSNRDAKSLDLKKIQAEIRKVYVQNS